MWGAWVGRAFLQHSGTGTLAGAGAACRAAKSRTSPSPGPSSSAYLVLPQLIDGLPLLGWRAVLLQRHRARCRQHPRRGHVDAALLSGGSKQARGGSQRAHLNSAKFLAAVRSACSARVV